MKINESIEYKNQTRINGEFTDRAARKWKPLLENKTGFRPIKDIAVKRNTAVLLENQHRALMEAANNSSMLGPMNGLTGGNLGNIDSYAPGDFRVPRVVLPMVRRIFPGLIANEVVGVQPMINPIGQAFAIRYEYAQGPLNRGDNGMLHTHKAEGAREGYVGAPEGVRGVYTMINVAADTNTVAVVKEGGYPETYPAVVVVATKNGKFVGKVSHFVEQVGGLVDPAVKETAECNTYAAAEEAGIALIKNAQGRVGISMPEGADNIALTAKNNEMGYQRLDTRYTGRADARLAQSFAGGRWKFRPEDWGVGAMLQHFEDTGAIAKAKFSFKKAAVEAGTRKLGSSWSLEIAEDLKNTNGIDIESHATQMMTYELQAEIDREITVRMLHAALANGEWSVWSPGLADGRWLGERNRAFYQNIIKQATRMQVRNRRGPANFIICTPDIVAILESLDEFVAMPTDTTVSTANLATAKVGTLNGGRFNVYCDTRTAVMTQDYGAGYDEMFDQTTWNGSDEAPEGWYLPNYAMLGYKGADNSDAGIIYCPYIPIMIQHAIDPYSFAPQVGLSTRYGVIDNLLGASLYYHVILIDSFASPMATGDNTGLYPTGNLGALPETPAQAPTFAFPVQSK